MRYVILHFFLLLSFSAMSQKDSERSFEAATIKQLEIYIDEVHKIDIKTYPGSEVLLISHSEGEYYNDIHLKMERLEEKFILSSVFKEDLQEGYDKLSAHKVFSLEVTLKIPEHLVVYLKSNIATVTAHGKYKELKVELQMGACTLLDFTGNAVVNTYRGPIQVETGDANINAFSRNGSVDLPAGIRGNHQLELQSIYGDIRVREN